MRNDAIVFISCGQQTEREKLLGADIAQLVRELTPFEPYFAEYQTSLEGLAQHVFGALHRCVALVAVLHARGSVESAKLVRASVWVEQEIAIAAFIQEALGRKLHVAAFIEHGVAREGVRESLLLNPKEFVETRDVLAALRQILPTWRQPLQLAHSIDLAIEYEEVRITQKRHEYRLVVLLTNRGVEAVAKYQVDVEFPSDLLDRPRDSVRFVPERSTRSHGFFRVTQDAHRQQLFSGDTLRVLSIEYFVDDHIYSERSELLKETVRAKLIVPGADPLVVEKSMAELQIF